jgi:putative endonuclease
MTQKPLNKPGYVYILTNKNKTVLYIGVTNNLKRRIEEHKFEPKNGSFSARYNLEKLVYYESHPWIDEAIAREKQLKAGSRKKKIELINALNPEWKDLYNEIKDWEDFRG